ncbi:MAG: hypothetical protein ACFFAO_06025 [Candidatus Hermodarchaeota archaeon]
MKTCYNYCPHCGKRIVFKMELDDIDTSIYPAPAYIHHIDKKCKKTSTFYFDSLLRVSYKELGKKKSKTGQDIKTISTVK